MQKRTFLSRFAAVAAVAGAGLASRLSAAAPAAESGSSASAQGAKQRAAVVYFTKTGNTESVARAVRAMTGADIYGVRTVKPYPEEYGATTDIVKDELDRNVIRELVPLEIDLTRYDVVVFATPTWWHCVPSIRIQPFVAESPRVLAGFSSVSQIGFSSCLREEGVSAPSSRSFCGP